MYRETRKLGELISVGPATLRDFRLLGIESVAQLARLYAMDAPSETEFQRLRELVSHSRP